jgi:hypothetical protein
LKASLTYYVIRRFSKIKGGILIVFIWVKIFVVSNLCSLFDEQNSLILNLAPRQQVFICLYCLFCEVKITHDSWARIKQDIIPILEVIMNRLLITAIYKRIHKVNIGCIRAIWIHHGWVRARSWRVCLIMTLPNWYRQIPKILWTKFSLKLHS